jgi:hypothetical protein
MTIEQPFDSNHDRLLPKSSVMVAEVKVGLMMLGSFGWGGSSNLYVSL